MRVLALLARLQRHDTVRVGERLRSSVIHPQARRGVQDQMDCRP
jgi:hypothetical protein